MDRWTADPFYWMVLALTALPYPLIHLGCFAVGRFQSVGPLCLLNLGASVGGVAAHTLLTMYCFVWQNDPFTIFLVMGAATIVLPMSGYGLLLATILLRCGVQHRS